jgi:hypothetical protein
MPILKLHGAAIHFTRSAQERTSSYQGLSIAHSTFPNLSLPEKMNEQTQDTDQLLDELWRNAQKDIDAIDPGM